MVSRDFVGALLQLNAEKQVPREQLIRTVEEAIQSAYRRVGGDEDIHVRIDPESGKIRVFRARRVVSEIEDPATEITVADAKQHESGAGLGDLVETEQLDQEAFGRIHAQTAKQVVLQRLREAERDVVFDQFASREGEMITGSVNRVEPRAIILDVGKNVEAILATTEQSPAEHYRIGQNVKAYVLEVRRTTRGPQIYVSRTHKGFLRRLFELEVPEIHAGTVEIKAIAREAGSRSKVAVVSRQDGLDPVGATVGQRGARVQAVVAELGGEKIDVIPWNDDPAVFVANALSPAQVINVTIDEEHRIANVTVPERMLSLAIGREGQNARLAAKLTGWRIDIRSDVSVAEAARAAAAPTPSAAPAAAHGAAPATPVPAGGRASTTPEAAPAAAEAGSLGTESGADSATEAAETSEAAAPPRPKRTRATAATSATNEASGSPEAPAAGEAGDLGAEPVAEGRTRARRSTAKPADEGAAAEEAAALAPAATKPRRTRATATESGAAAESAPAAAKPRRAKATAIETAEAGPAPSAPSKAPRRKVAAGETST
jgi:N utilization substance protein A